MLQTKHDLNFKLFKIGLFISFSSKVVGTTTAKYKCLTNIYKKAR